MTKRKSKGRKLTEEQKRNWLKRKKMLRLGEKLETLLGIVVLHILQLQIRNLRLEIGLLN